MSIAVIQLSNYCALLLDGFADGGGKSVKSGDLQQLKAL
jgi:hypothetical protein